MTATLKKVYIFNLKIYTNPRKYTSMKQYISKIIEIYQVVAVLKTGYLKI